MVHNIIFTNIQCNLLCSKVYIGFIHKILDMRRHHFFKINFTFLSFSIIIKWDISKLSLNMRGNTICQSLYIILLPYMCFKMKKKDIFLHLGKWLSPSAFTAYCVGNRGVNNNMNLKGRSFTADLFGDRLVCNFNCTCTYIIPKGLKIYSFVTLLIYCCS